VKNLLGFTQEFDNAAYTKTNSTITANATAAPDGSVTADKLVEDAGSVSPFANQNFTSIVGTTYTFTCYGKEDSSSAKRYLMLLMPSSQFGSNIRGVFDLAAGTFTVTGTATVSMEFVGNGWWRCRVTATATLAAAAAHQVGLYDVVTGSVSAYTGDGTSGDFIWGAQLSDSASLDPYVYNPAAAATSTAYYGPRFDYDPVTLAARGLLIEEQRTNSIRNNTMVGAVAGTPGTLPTNWSQLSVNGVTRSVVGAGSEDGISYIDVQLQGTPASTNNFAIRFEQTTQIAASAGQTWSSSSYVRLVGGSLANAPVQVGVNERNSGGGFVTASATSIVPTSAPLGSQRYLHTRTLTGATTAFVDNGVIVACTSGADIDITLRIGLPQLELGAFSTSVIPTSTAAATRAADVATMVGDNFANWYRADEGTLFAEGSSVDSISGTTSRRYAELHDGSTSNLINVEFRNTNQSRFSVVDAGVSQASINGVGTINQTSKIAGAYKVDDFSFAANGALGTPDTSGSVPVVNRMTIGSRSDNVGAATINGHIRRIAFINRRVSNAELQALTV
jgi:hypothetical protein